MSATQESRTYRGTSLEELLPQIRAELGPDAVITCQREGIVGGIGGFFGKRCVEVEAEGCPPPFVPTGIPAMPRRAILDLYDSGERPGWEPPHGDSWEPAPATPAFAAAEEEDEDDAPVVDNELLRMVLETASPFATELETALAREAETEQQTGAADPLPPAATAAPPGTPALAAAAPAPASAPASLDGFGLPAALRADLEREIESALRPFRPGDPLADLARSALAGRIRVRHGWKTRRRVIALIGEPGSGRTLAAAKLARAYARGAGLDVAALSLETPRAALRLASLTEDAGVELDVADGAGIPLALQRLARRKVVVVDLPPVSLEEPDSIPEAGRLLAALKADEVHLVVPAGSAAPEVLLNALRTEGVVPDRLLLTFAGERGPAGSAVGLSLGRKLPISYVTSGDGPSSPIRPADPCAVAHLAIP